MDVRHTSEAIAPSGIWALSGLVQVAAFLVRRIGQSCILPGREWELSFRLGMRRSSSWLAAEMPSFLSIWFGHGGY